MESTDSNPSLPATGEELPASAPPDPKPFTPLAPEVINLWRLTNAIGSVVILLLLGIPALIISLAVPAARLYVGLAWLAIAALRIWLFLWYPGRAYAAWGYRIDDRVLEIRHGIFFREIELLPLPRLQHVDLRRGPLERYFGLASLILNTAGTHNAVLTIPGLNADEAIRLRDHLVAVGVDDAV
jgi:uncharacterized protein